MTIRTIVVGAGIGGLTTALALARQGTAVTVVEAADALRSVGAGINLQPEAVGVLEGLGLSDALAAASFAPRRHLYTDRYGEARGEDPRGLAAGQPWPQYSLHRGALHRILLDAVHHTPAPIRLLTGARLVDLESGPDGVRCQLWQNASGELRALDADVVVGADGLHSAVLAHLHPHAAPHWSGILMWRGTVAGPAPLDGRTMVIANSEDGHRLIVYPVPGPEDHRHTLVNWVLLAPAGESGPAAELSGGHPVPPDAALTRLGGWNLDRVGLERLVEPGGSVLEYPMVDRDPLPHWGHDGVTLLGDAAHLMYPVGANGATQAVLDARALADELATTTDPHQALTRYEARRRPATEQIVRANRAMDRDERDAATSDARHDPTSLARITAAYDRAISHDPSPVPPRKVFPVTVTTPAFDPTAPSTQSSPDPDDLLRMREMLFGSVLTSLLSIAADLGLVDLLADGPVPVDDLARRTGSHPPSLYRVMRTLAMKGVFTETAPRTFAATPLADTLRTSTPGSLRDAACSAGLPGRAHAIADLAHTVRTGEPAFDHHFGTDWWTYLAAHPEQEATFHRYLRYGAGRVHNAALDVSDFSRSTRLVDVGGNRGHLLARVLGAHPHLEGVVFDAPDVVTGAPQVLAEAEVADRVEVVGGDFFDAVPAGADTYVLSWILHDWNDEQAVRILRNIREAMDPDAQVLVIDAVLPTGDTPHPGKYADIAMLALQTGGERTEEQFAAILAAAGLELVETRARHAPTSVLIARAG